MLLVGDDYQDIDDNPKQKPSGHQHHYSGSGGGDNFLDNDEIEDRRGRKTIMPNQRPFFDDSMDTDSKHSKFAGGSGLPTSSSSKKLGQLTNQNRRNGRQNAQPRGTQSNQQSNSITRDDYENLKEEMGQVQEILMIEQNNIIDEHHDFIESFIGCIKDDSESFQALNNQGSPLLNQK